ncbi:MAG: hypothetical protein SF051_03605 [Elusimicrobiota bacterium]|nr:hypothetical protein [Elusimicrobiota bacterium]
MRPLFLVALLASAAACAPRPGGGASYRDPQGRFAAEVPGDWRVLGPEGARLATFFAPPGADGAPVSVSVMFYPAATPEGRDAAAFVAAHRGSGRPLGPVRDETVGARPVRRYALALTRRGGEYTEDTAVFSNERGVLVVLHDASRADADRTRAGFERVLATLEF